MKYPIAPLYVRPWTLNGISPRLIESHYEVNYGGTVNRLNVIVEQLEYLDPAKTPAEIVRRLNQEIGRILANAEHKQQLAAIGIELMGSTTEGFADLIKAESVRMAPILRSAFRQR